jgi:hypothetical protein
MEKRRIALGVEDLSFLMSVSPKLSTVTSFIAKNCHENSWLRLKDVQKVPVGTQAEGQLE